MYGLEVCKSLYLPEPILEYAYEIRNKYSSHVLENSSILSQKVTSTKYNSHKIKGICEKCRKKMGEEIHHLQPQKDTDNAGYLDGEWVHKNHPANLLSVCSQCHDEIHKKEEDDNSSVISGITLTSSFRKKVIRKIKTTKGYKIDVDEDDR